MKRSILPSLTAFLLVFALMRVQGAPIAARVPGGILGLEFAWYDITFEFRMLYIEYRVVILNIWLDFLFILAYTWFLLSACKAVAPRFINRAIPRFFARLAVMAALFDMVENVAMLGRLYHWFGQFAVPLAFICAAIKFAAVALVLLFLLYSLLWRKMLPRAI
jgi:hypothetical protein